MLLLTINKINKHTQSLLIEMMVLML